MNKKILFSIVFLFCIAFILVGCKDEASNKPKEDVQPYKEFDAVAEDFFIAYQIKDYDTMKKYLPKSEIDKSVEITEARKGEILHPEYKELMKGRYKITATDYYYKSHNQIIYFVEFFDPVTENLNRLGIYGVEKEGNQYLIMNRIDSQINGLHFKDETGRSYLRTSTLKDLMKKYPESVYKVKTITN